MENIFSGMLIFQTSLKIEQNFRKVSTKKRFKQLSEKHAK